MRFQLITPPTEEPITRNEAKQHLRIDADITDDDLLIDAMITAAREHAETECQRALVTQGWRAVLDGFPSWIELDRGTVQSVDSVRYLDTASTWQTMPTTDWVADLSAPPVRVAPRFGKIWPIALPQIGAVQVDFIAGYGNAATVPQGIKRWMLLRIGSLYENREEFAVVNRGTLVAMPFVDRLLDPYRVVSM